MVSLPSWNTARTAVALTTAVAVLSVFVGLANIGAGAALTGPLSPFVPEAVQRAAGFTGTLTGFLVFFGAYGLRRGYRVGWYATTVLLPVTALQGLLQSSSVSVPLVVLSLISLPTLVLTRDHFTREWAPSPTQLAAGLSLVGALSYGTLGSYALREEFEGIGTLVDAFYYTVVTASTVGYGDVTPATPLGRLFGLSVLVVNVATFAVALGVLLTPAIEAQFSKALGRMTETQFELLDDHVLVLGYGELTEPILDELGDDVTFVVVTEDEARARQLRDREREIDVLVGDPSDEATLRRVATGRARAALVATNDDAEDALTILTARELNPAIRLVAAATQRENVPKLRRAGADTVISPASIGGHLLVESALGAADTEEVAERLAREGVDDPSAAQ